MADEQQVHTLKINDQEYEIEKLSDAAKAEIRNLRFAEGEVQRLTALLALAPNRPQCLHPGLDGRPACGGETHQSLARRSRSLVKYAG